MKKYILGVGVTILVIGLVVSLFIFLRNSPTKPATNTPQKNYVALGDSVAAGVGLATAADSSACDRTNESYPSRLAQMNSYKLQNIACSGATYPAGVLGTQDVNQLSVPAQIDALFGFPSPDIITITAGANDVQWAANITTCYTGTCGSASQTAAIDKNIVTVGQSLTTTLSRIQEHYKTALPHVLVTGYYQVFPATTLGCTDLIGISQSELDWSREQQTKLNETIKVAASKFSFASFITIDFSGHELCTSTQWVQSLTDSAPFHPNEAGQQAIAQQISKQATH